MNQRYKFASRGDSFCICAMMALSVLTLVCFLVYGERIGILKVVGPGLCLIVIALGFRELAAIRRQVRKVEKRRPMSDEEFLKSVDVAPELHPVCIKVRKALAAEVGIAREALYPSDTLQEYGRLQSVGPDYMGILMAIEDEFGFTMSKGMEKACDKLLPWARPDKFTVGQLASRLTVWLVESLPALKEERSADKAGQEQ